MTGIRELTNPWAMSPAPEHVRVSVLGGRTQLDVALPLDVPLASLVPELAQLVRSRDVEQSTDEPPQEARSPIWVLSRLDPLTLLQPNETLRRAGVIDGELLGLTAEHTRAAPTLYDDVVDAAARLNKAAYPGWNAAAARWISFAGLYVASAIWVCLIAGAGAGSQRAIVLGLAAVVVAAMVGIAALAHRSYRQPDIGAAVGWATVPITAATVWALVRGLGDYAGAAGCALLLALNAFCYWAIGTGRWGYVASAVFFAASGSAILGHAVGARAQTAGVVLAVAAALACLLVSRLAGRLAPFEPPAVESDADRDAAMFESPFAPKPTATEAAANPPGAAMPTAEAVWARVRSAALTRSAIFTGLAVSALCGAATVLRAQPQTQWAALAFAGIGAAALGLHARLRGSALERISLGAPGAALAVMGCVSAQHGTAQMSAVGFATLLAIAVAASVTAVTVAGDNLPHRLAIALTYLEYAAFAALIPVALWVDGIYAALEMG
jgi:type VII secretion integral membrane protein EccD